MILIEWMGCARLIWNAKCEDELYMTRYARRYCPIGTYAPIDQTSSQYKSQELTPWLSDCPSQILRNSVVNWYKTYGKFMRGESGKPKRKPFKDSTGSIHYFHLRLVMMAIHAYSLEVNAKSYWLFRF